MIKWKANKILDKFPFRFVHSQKEHSSRISWLFENANFEDASGTQFFFDRPNIFPEGYAVVDGYLNDQMLKAFQRHFEKEYGSSKIFGFKLSWGENFESIFSQKDEEDLLEKESLKEMIQVLDLHLSLIHI